MPGDFGKILRREQIGLTWIKPRGSCGQPLTSRYPLRTTRLTGVNAVDSKNSIVSTRVGGWKKVSGKLMERLLHRQFMTSARYATWADERVYQAVTASLADEHWDISRHNVQSLAGLLNSLLMVGRLWLALLRGHDQGIASLDEPLYEDLEELREAQVADDVELCDYVHGLAEERDAATDSYQALDSTPHADSQQELLVELCAQQVHFRGRVCERVSVLDAEQPDLDYFEFLRKTGR